MQQRFSTDEVVALTGMTPRQLQWWDERGIVRPMREGRRRVYSLDDLAEVVVIGELRLRGFSLQRVRKVMRYLQQQFGKRLVETVSAGSEYHLLTDGKHVYLETSPQQVIDILKSTRQPLFTICLSDTVRHVRAEVSSGRLSLPDSQPDHSSGNERAPNDARPAPRGVPARVQRQRKAS